MLTLKKAIDLTRRVWWELARTGTDDKRELKTVDVTPYLSECPLCEYLQKSHIRGGSRLRIGNHHTVSLCKSFCPFEWPINNAGDSVCFGHGGLYIKWRREHDVRKRKESAMRISELPLREQYR